MLGRNMSLYFFLVDNEARRYLAYPIEVFASLAKRLITPVLFGAFWYAVATHSNIGISPRDLIAYSLVSGGL